MLNPPKEIRGRKIDLDSFAATLRAQPIVQNHIPLASIPMIVDNTIDKGKVAIVDSHGTQRLYSVLTET